MHTLLAFLLSFTLFQPAPNQSCAVLEAPIEVVNDGWLDVPIANAHATIILDVTLNLANPLGSGSRSPILFAASNGDDVTLLKHWNNSFNAASHLPTTQSVILGNHNLLLAGTLDDTRETLSFGIHADDSLESITIHSVCTQPALTPLAPQ